MRSLILTACILAAAAPILPAEAQRDRREWNDRDRGRDTWREGRNYDWNHPDSRTGRYDAARYYRDDRRQYRERRLGRNDRVYRGSDGRYYCRRQDGTTGLIVGALAGGVLGNVIAPNGSDLLGTVIGAAGGGLLGRQIDRGGARCR